MEVAVQVYNISLVLGSIDGINSAGADTRAGIGITNPERRLHMAETGATATRGVAFDRTRQMLLPLQQDQSSRRLPLLGGSLLQHVCLRPPRIH
jgi:hypothetical protein